MNNFDKVKNMNKKEIAEFLNGLLNDSYETIIDKWFDKNYCESICPDIRVIYENKKEIWKECDFEGKCSYQNCRLDMIKLWLNDKCE
jgi:hypothetical protein